MMSVEAPVADYGTALKRTTIFVARDGGYTWVRRPGSAASAAASGYLSAGLQKALQAASTASFEFAVPTRLDDASVYHVGGRRSLFRHLADPHPAVVTSVLRALGAGLFRLHSTPLPVEGLPGPVHLRRLGRCLAGEIAAPSTARLRHVLRSVLGQGRLDDATAWLRHFSAPPTKVLLHGGPGFGTVVPTESPARPTALLSAEEAYVGDSHADLGWICGEILELHLAARTAAGVFQHRSHERFARDLCDGYGGPVDWPDLGRACVLRMLTHIYDFVAYVGWHDSIESQVAAVAAVTDAVRASPSSIESLFVHE